MSSEHKGYVLAKTWPYQLQPYVCTLNSTNKFDPVLIYSAPRFINLIVFSMFIPRPVSISSPFSCYAFSTPQTAQPPGSAVEDTVFPFLTHCCQGSEHTFFFGMKPDREVSSRAWRNIRGSAVLSVLIIQSKMQFISLLCQRRCFFILRLGSELATNTRMHVSLITSSVRHVATDSSQ